MRQPGHAQQDLDVGLRMVHAFLALRGYRVMVKLVPTAVKVSIAPTIHRSIIDPPG